MTIILSNLNLTARRPMSFSPRAVATTDPWKSAPMVHGLSLATITGRWLGETPFAQVSMPWALASPETVHRRPCMTSDIETWLSDSRVGNISVADHRSRRPVLSPLRNCVDRCHIWPYWASRCKPWRRMLKDRGITGQNARPDAKVKRKDWFADSVTKSTAWAGKKIVSCTFFVF